MLCVLYTAMNYSWEIRFSQMVALTRAAVFSDVLNSSVFVCEIEENPGRTMPQQVWDDTHEANPRKTDRTAGNQVGDILIIVTQPSGQNSRFDGG